MIVVSLKAALACLTNTLLNSFINKHSLCSWSGGKDSCFALLHAIQEGYEVKVLLNVLNEEGRISRPHGIPATILQQQAAAMAIPIHLISSSWQEYEKLFTNALVDLKKKHNLSYAVFGDIDLQAHRDWEEKVCNTVGLSALLPLWQQDRKQLVLAMLEKGIETIIVSCNEKMGPSFIGRALTLSLLEELEYLDIDPCGENGEYHTLVLNCPLFNNRIDIKPKGSQRHNNYWFALF